MAKKIVGFIKLQVPAGKANPSPPIGPALGQRGLNIMEFCKGDDAEQQPEHPPACGSRVLERADAVLHDDLAVGVADHHGGGLDPEPALAVELLQLGERLVGVAVGIEGHGEHVARARGVRPAVLVGVGVGVGHAAQRGGPEGERSSHRLDDLCARATRLTRRIP